MYHRNLAYPTLFQRGSEENLWVAHIPFLDGSQDEPGAGTCGDDLDDCRQMASGLVDAWLVDHLRNGRPIPVPGSLPDGDGWELVGPSLKVSWVLTLRELRAAAHMSQAEAARRLKVKQPVYARLEDPATANPTLSTVDRMQKVFGVRISLTAV